MTRARREARNSLISLRLSMSSTVGAGPPTREGLPLPVSSGPPTAASPGSTLRLRHFPTTGARHERHPPNDAPLRFSTTGLSWVQCAYILTFGGLLAPRRAPGAAWPVLAASSRPGREPLGGVRRLRLESPRIGSVLTSTARSMPELIRAGGLTSRTARYILTKRLTS